MLRRGALLAIVAVAVLFFGVRVPRAYGNLKSKHERIRQLQQRNADLRNENEKRRQWVEDLSSNPAEQENVLRERYHKQRQGDTTFIIQPEHGKKSQ